MVPIVVPYVTLNPATRALGEHLHAAFVRMEDDTHYYRTVKEYWERGAGLFIIEQDIVFTYQQVDEILECDQLWCGFPMEYPPFGVYYGGMQKFSAELMHQQPELLLRAGSHHDNVHSAKHYCVLDAVIQAELRSVSIAQHKHQGLLDHRKVYSHDECPHKVALWKQNGFLS